MCIMRPSFHALTHKQERVINQFFNLLDTCSNLFEAICAADIHISFDLLLYFGQTCTHAVFEHLFLHSSKYRLALAFNSVHGSVDVINDGLLLGGQGRAAAQQQKRDGKQNLSTPTMQDLRNDVSAKRACPWNSIVTAFHLAIYPARSIGEDRPLLEPDDAH